jgi:serine/threonine protein kinase
MQELVNSVIAHYAIKKHLATGGMSNVYLAHDLFTEQEVALKLVPRSNQDFCQRFEREAYTVSSLHHEYILPALDYGEFDCWCYLATPYMPDGTLHDLLQEGALSLEKAGLYLEQIASALYYAHQQGIIHRDIKASNLLMREGDGVFLADFGLVKSLDSIAESLTETGFLVGTAEYMAPELAEEKATERSDIYALGVVLYQMLTGEMPFKGITPIGTFMQHLSKQPLPPSQVNPRVPAAFDSVVLRALEKQPERRYQSALELAQAYQHVLVSSTQLSITTIKKVNLSALVPTVRFSPPFRRKPRNKMLAAFALVTCLFLLSGLGISMSMFHGTEHNSNTVVGQHIVHSSLHSISASSLTVTPRTNPTASVNTPVPSPVGQTPSTPVNVSHLTPVGISSNTPANPPAVQPVTPPANTPANPPASQPVTPPSGQPATPPGSATSGNQNKSNGNGKAKGHDK